MFEEIEKAIAEIQQPRSRFQLERFTIGQHATPEMQYYQVCIELQDMIYKYKLAEINEKKVLAKISKLRKSNDEVKEYKAQELELGLAQTQLALIGAKREIGHLVDIWNSFSYKYTREEIESAQPEYWKARLTNNANAMLLGGGGVNPAHIEAMEQAGVLEPFIKLQEEKIQEIE
jgi:hypothetical protein